MFMSQTVREILQGNDNLGIFAVSIEHSTGTLRYCTGNRSIEIDSNWHDPRGMTIPSLNIAAGGSAARLTVADDYTESDALERLHYADPFSGGLMWWYCYVWAEDGSGWNEIFSYAWTMQQCMKSERSPSFEFQLSGATGTYPRAALEIIGRACGLTYGDALCQGTIGTYKTCDGSMADCVLRGRQASYRGAVMAPEPGHEIKFFYRQSPYGVGSSHYIPPPPPGGENRGNEGVDTPTNVVHEPNGMHDPTIIPVALHDESQQAVTS